MIRIGCAGWSLPRDVQEAFGEGASHLARYATRFPVAEINSSFHRPHKRSLYEKWAASVPEDFRFCAKLPKTITHEKRLVDCEGLLDAFLEQAGGLGTRLACLLVQLPPSFAFDAAVARAFLELLRSRFPGSLAMEPRHATWFEPEAEALLERLTVVRVAADPAVVPEAATPGGYRGAAYVRLHGTPRVYYSAYDAQALQNVASLIRHAAAGEVWCIFDNTASGAATEDALLLRQALGVGDPA